MKSTGLLFFTILFFLILQSFAQNPDWIVYYPWNSGLPINSVTEIAIDTNGNKWVGNGGFGEGGLSLFDDENWTLYDNTNAFNLSFDNFITALAVDKQNGIWTATQFEPFVYYFNGEEWNSVAVGYGSKVIVIAVDMFNRKWIGWEGGGIASLSILNDTILTVFSILNTNIPSSSISSVFFEDNDTSKVWMTGYEKLIFFNGDNWTYYNYENSGIPQGWYLREAIVDHIGNVWIAADQGVVFYDKTNWTVYTPSNSPLPQGYVYRLCEDKDNKLWMGLQSGGGLVSVKDGVWEQFNNTNSPLPNNQVFSLTVDSLNNKWIGTNGGLAVYNETGVLITALPDRLKPAKTQLSISPNPVQNQGTLKYRSINNEHTQITIYDIHRSLVKEICNRKLFTGLHVFELQLNNLTKGTYIIKSTSASSEVILKFIKN